MKLIEAIIKRNSIKAQLNNVLSIIRSCSITSLKTPVDIESQIERYIELLGEKARLDHQITRTNLSYKAKINNNSEESDDENEDDEEPEFVTLQQLYDMIINNLNIAKVLYEQIESFNEFVSDPNCNKNMHTNFDYCATLNQLHEIENRVVYLRSILSQADATADLIED